MHEMGVLIKLVEQLEQLASSNHISSISTVSIEVGQLSGILPFYLKKYYAMLIKDHSLLQNSTLDIREIPAEGLCQECGFLYNIVKNKGLCPHCGSRKRKIISGRDFVLKNIVYSDDQEADSWNHSKI